MKFGFAKRVNYDNKKAHPLKIATTIYSRMNRNATTFIVPNNNKDALNMKGKLFTMLYFIEF